MNLLALAVAILDALGAAAQARDVKLHAELSPESVRVGEALTLTLSVSPLPPGATVIFPELPDSGTVTALGPPVPVNDSRPGTRSALYELAAWDAGELKLPSGEVRVVSDGSELKLPLPDLVVRVRSVLPAEADIDTLSWQPAADVLGGDWSRQEKLAAAALALAVLLAAVLYLRRRGSAAPVPVPPGPSPRERALAALDWLEASGLGELGELKAFYSALSQVLREFLAETDGRWRLDLTTPELTAAVAGDGMDPYRAHLLGQMLVDADMVKFARRRPSLEEAAEALERVRRWIDGFELAVSAEEATGLSVLDELFSGAWLEEESSGDDGGEWEGRGGGGDRAGLGDDLDGHGRGVAGDEQPEAGASESADWEER